jgi:phosphoserine phosphatase RsbU/P
MKLLVAEDDPIFRRALEKLLANDYELVFAVSGDEAWHILQMPGSPRLALLDWMMPGISGVDICRRVRGLRGLEPVYMVLLTARQDLADVVSGLEAGADDDLTKPFEPQELRARLRTGARIIELHLALADRLRELEDALASVKQLQGLLPICCYCKRIRDDRNYWQQLETYVTEHSEAVFSHGLCPECYERVMHSEMIHAQTVPPRP